MFTSYLHKLTALQDLGFSTPLIHVGKEHKDLVAFYESVNNIRSELPYEIDGIVIRLDNEQEFVSMGKMSAKDKPNAAHALKFPAMELPSPILGYEWSEEGSLFVTPVAIIAPIIIGGAEITRASLKSAAWIRENLPKIGSVVLVSRQGDVIPMIQRIIERGDGADIEIPTHCFCCKHELSMERLDTSVEPPVFVKRAHPCCMNPSCNRKTASRIYSFLSKLKIKGLGRATLMLYAEAGVTLEHFIPTQNISMADRCVEIESLISSNPDLSLNIWAKIKKELFKL